MIVFETEKGILDIKDTEISLSFNNAFLDKEHYPRGYSFPFVVPSTPQNDAILGHLYRLDALSIDLAAAIKTTIHTDFMQIKGYITITNFANNTYELHFSNEQKIFIENLDTEIETLLTDEINLFSDGKVNCQTFDLVYYIYFLNWDIFNRDELSASLSIDNIVFTIHGILENNTEAKYSELATLINDTLPQHATATEFYIEIKNLDRNFLEIQNIQNIKIEKRFNQVLYEHCRIADYVNNANSQISNIVFPVVHTPNEKTKEETPRTIIINNIDSDGYIMRNMPYNLSINQYFTKNRNSISPAVRVKYLLDLIFQKLGYTTENVFNNDFFDLYYFNITKLDEMIKISEDTELEINRWRTTFMLNEIAPQKTVKTWLQELATMFGLWIDVEDKKVKIQYKKELKKKKFDITEDIKSNTLSYSFINTEGVTIAQGINKIKIGKGKQEYKIPFNVFESSVNIANFQRLINTANNEKEYLCFIKSTGIFSPKLYKTTIEIIEFTDDIDRTIRVKINDLECESVYTNPSTFTSEQDVIFKEVTDNLINQINKLEYVKAYALGMPNDIHYQKIAVESLEELKVKSVTYCDVSTEVITLPNKEYLYATSDNLSASLVPQMTYSLKIEGNSGLYERLLKDYVKYLNEIQSEVEITENQLFISKVFKNQVSNIEFETENGKMRAVLKTLRIKLTKNTNTFKLELLR